MIFAEVMAQLKAMGTEQNRKIYRRHGAGEDQFGVSVPNLRKLARQIKKDQELAEQLWASGTQDARCLATLVAEPKAMSREGLERWSRDFDYYVVVDMFTSNVMAATPHGAELAGQWCDADHEYIEQAGWNTVAVLAMRDRLLPHGWFEACLERIEREVSGAKNRVRHAMNNALIAIGLRNEALRARAEDAAKRIGKAQSITARQAA